MNNELTIKPNTALVTADESLFNSFASGGYLPNIRLMNGQSGPVTMGQANVGDFVLFKTKEEIINLGKEVELMVIAFRYTAMFTGEPKLFYYNPTNPGFQTIKANAKAGIKDYLCGIEFLFWIPSVQSFATMYLASKSALNAAADIRGYIDSVNNRPGCCVLFGKFAKNSKGSWWALQVKDCTAGISTLPTQEDFDKVLLAFQSPTDSVVEMATAPAASNDRG